MIRTAVISEDQLYRYELGRTWGDGKVAVFVMLNPSTADANIDDSTIRRCVGFAKQWELDGIKVVNLYAFRSTFPQDLKTAADPIGPENGDYIDKAISSEATAAVVAAWGASLPYPGAAPWTMLRVARATKTAGLQLQCLGRTKEGLPRHPCRLPAKVDLVPFEWGLGSP